MNILLSVILISFIIYKKTYKNFSTYHTTMLYGALMILLYDFICKDHLLWEHDSFPFYSHFTGEILHAFVLMPSIILLFLSYFPTEKGSIYILKWTVASFLIEGIFYLTGSIIFQNGFEYWMDLFFYGLMFTMLRLHHIKPVLTYLLSIPIIVVLVSIFDVPIPWEE